MNASYRSAKRGNRLFMTCGIIGVVSALCAVAVMAGYFFLAPPDTSQPMVLIHAPSQGEQIAAGEQVTVRAVARDEHNITRIELWDGDQLLDTERSLLPGGISSLPLLTTWQPDSAGRHTLTVRAFNGQRRRGQAAVVVEVVEMADQDADGVPDASDVCVAEAGYPLADGCPDQDRDGIADAADACPAEAGLPEAGGCPSPRADDRDGDGVLDEADTCPDTPGAPVTEGCPDSDGDFLADASDACPAEPGWPDGDGCPTPDDRDGDGILDAEDACPDVAGLEATAGCPDGDGDGVRDGEDLCPDQPGLPENRGCPDRDGDGVPDGADLRPEEPGLPEDGGAPPGPDGDGDGAPDDADPCPAEPGAPEDGFCPPPEEDEVAESGPAFSLLPDWFLDLLRSGAVRATTEVEVQGLSFDVDRPYNQVWCYLRFGDGPVVTIGQFEAIDETHWDIAEWVGGEDSHIWVPVGDSLEISLSCMAIGEWPGGGESVYSLGEVSVSHPSDDWDGQAFQATSGGGDGWFRAGYRMCSPSCEGAGIPAPIIHTQYRWLGRERLVWAWYGNPEEITGYMVYVDGARTDYVSRNAVEIDDYLPACGETREIAVTAARVSPTEIVESAFSNVWMLEGEPCPYSMRVTFDVLDVHDPPADEDGLHRPGPIYGEFWLATEDRVRGLEFNACWCYVGPGATLWGTCDGLELTRRSYDIQNDIFGWIEREMASCLGSGCRSDDFFAPPTNQLTIEVPRDGTVTIGARIMDCDERLNPSDTLFERTVPIRGVMEDGALLPPGDYLLNGDYADLYFRIETFPGGP